MKRRSSSLWPSHAGSPGKRGDGKQTEHSGWVFVLHWIVLLQNHLSFKAKEILCPFVQLMTYNCSTLPSRFPVCEEKYYVMMYAYFITFGEETETLQKHGNSDCEI